MVPQNVPTLVTFGLFSFQLKVFNSFFCILNALYHLLLCFPSCFQLVSLIGYIGNFFVQFF